MREIKFRGKTKKGKWVYGYYYFSYNEHKIMCIADDDLNGERTLSYPVMPETISQYTGLKDTNGNEIYEGDHFGESAYPVTWDKDCGAFMYEDELMHYADCWEVTGNIHDKN